MQNKCINEIIDEVLVSVMKAPKTFTCEDVVEISTHGGMTAPKNPAQDRLINIAAAMTKPSELM